MVVVYVFYVLFCMCVLMLPFYLTAVLHFTNYKLFPDSILFLFEHMCVCVCFYNRRWQIFQKEANKDCSGTCVCVCACVVWVCVCVVCMCGVYVCECVCMCVCLKGR